MSRIETKTEPMTINFGPQHPSMHGCFRIIVTLEGEDVIDCEPVLERLTPFYRSTPTSPPE